MDFFHKICLQKAVSTLSTKLDELNKRLAEFWLVCLARQCRNGRRAKQNKSNLTNLAHLNRWTKRVQLEINMLKRYRLI